MVQHYVLYRHAVPHQQLLNEPAPPDEDAMDPEGSAGEPSISSRDGYGSVINSSLQAQREQ
jgi:hypothetical protein